ncbi:MAG: phenylalanine--tRNA ligase subunit beta [Nitrososphaerales archaeon]
MPVLKIYFSRIVGMTGLSRERVLDRLPFLGLDIEGTDDESVRIEYNPNRADFSTDYGVARALRGLVGSEVGLPTYRVEEGGRIGLAADANLAGVRPWIACAAARGLSLDDETIRQLISMQEDLHNGLGRKRKKAAIGLHDLDAIAPPLTYRGVPPSFRFVPLGASGEMTIEEVLRETETGVAYGPILRGTTTYPILHDSKGTVLSFPPVINGARTRVDARTRNLFVDVTSTDERVGAEVLAIICSALADAGGRLESVRVDYGAAAPPRVTPEMAPTRMRFDAKLATAMTGLELGASEMRECLERSRLGFDEVAGDALIPRYRVDILHPVDLAEEVAIGYGLDRIAPLYPASKEPGRLDRGNVALDRIAESVSMAGFIETMSFDLVDAVSLYERFSRPADLRIEVEDPRTLEHHLLRDSLLPSLMTILARNVKAAYPQRLFEVGRVFQRDSQRSGKGILERPHLAAVVAHSSSSFSEARSYLDALVRQHRGAGVETRVARHWAFADGRCAEAVVEGAAVGHLGELKPSAVAAFGLDVPVAGFEIDLSGFL